MADPSGQLKWWGTSYSVRVRFRDGTRRWLPLPRGMSHVQAAKAAGNLAALAKTETYDVVVKRLAGIVDESVELWVDRWLEVRTARGLESVRDDRSRFRTHIQPLIGHESMARVKRSKVEDVRDALDARVQAGDIQWKTAQSVWGVARAMFRDAATGKRRELRVREDNPCEGVAPPDRGTRRAKQFLFPNELLALVSHPLVPLRARVLYALAVYLFARRGELDVLAWEDLDLTRGHVHIHRALRRYTREEKTTKSGSTRRFVAEHALLPLLKALRRAEPDEPRVIGNLFRPDRYELSRGLRAHLAAVGVRRPELFASDRTRKCITFHDLRATGITWMAIRGDDPLKIKQRAGHANLSTTEGYIRVAEDLRDCFGDVFPTLPDDLVHAVDALAPALEAHEGAAQ